MNQDQENKRMDDKENTLDILVSPKKSKPPVPPAPPPRQATAPEGKKPSAEMKKTPAEMKKPPLPAEGKRETPLAAGLMKKEPSVKKDAPVAPPRPAKPSVREEEAKDRTRAVRTPRPAATTAERAEATRVSTAIPRVNTEEKNPVKSAKVKPRTPAPESAKKKKWQDSFRAISVRALIYIAVVIGFSTLFSVLGIRWANDVFALVKTEVVATVTLPENASISEVADILAENGIIEYPSLFRLYIGFKNRDNTKPLVFKAGEHEVKSTLNYDQLVSMMKDRKTRQIIRITIPEGYTTDEIIDLFLSKGMGTREGFVDAINNYPYNYSFMEKLNAIELSPLRRYRLEGYLFPDTYDFYTDSTEVTVIDKMLAAFQHRFDEEYYARLDELGMNLDEIVTLASIVQMEGKYASDFYSISGVFHNRLKSRTLKKLESDATVQYCLEERKENLTYDDLAVDDPYNTYIYEGLPPSAIANPGWEALTAAMYPEKNEYYYFVSDTDGSTLFGKTLAEHLRNVAAVARAKENGTSVD